MTEEEKKQEIPLEPQEIASGPSSNLFPIPPDMFM